ncbi:hypothetical protein P873_13985 [Arenimonas composti TR7-09 = DSM 18010]|uniref:Uncharacterized protein n=1 Tax=Arenimonas composti TR7-09 = DSM 18010 TaxID=1121013 RepID=A0A091BCQ2_9GAMM|nr:hypothetical protein P873_13985 [Arenimonas composti TR7-09 = DSM 18010]
MNDELRRTPATRPSTIARMLRKIVMRSPLCTL